MRLKTSIENGALTAERARELLDYDPDTGVLTWKVGRRGPARAGAVSGYLGGNGYLRTRVDGRMYRNHRVAWLIATGSWPADQIDHINGDRTDNRLANLREATARQNAHNTGLPVNNTSGFKGVHWHNHKGKWRAQVSHDGRLIYIGYFDTPEQASVAYEFYCEQTRGEFHRPETTPDRCRLDGKTPTCVRTQVGAGSTDTQGNTTPLELNPAEPSIPQPIHAGNVFLRPVRSIGGAA